MPNNTLVSHGILVSGLMLRAEFLGFTGVTLSQDCLQIKIQLLLLMRYRYLVLMRVQVPLPCGLTLLLHLAGNKTHAYSVARRMQTQTPLVLLSPTGHQAGGRTESLKASLASTRYFIPSVSSLSNPTGDPG